MTAIVGFNYIGGVLMLADTEESLGEGAKSECDKLYRFNFPSGSIITGGAGDSHFIDCANQEMQTFFSSKLKTTPTEMLPELNKFAGGFFKAVILPAKDFSCGLEMLIAVNCDKKESLLFSWKKNRVVWTARKHMSIGSGMAWTHPLLRDIQFCPSKESALFHGVRLMCLAKRAVPGVGGRNIEALALQDDGRTHSFGTIATKKVEDLVINYEDFKIKVLDGNVSTIAADDQQIEPELERNVEANWEFLARTLKSYRESYREILKPQSKRSASGDH